MIVQQAMQKSLIGMIFLDSLLNEQHEKQNKMEDTIRVDREFDRVMELETADRVCFRVSDDIFNAFSKATEPTVTVRRVTLYDEWSTVYALRDVSFFRHCDGSGILALMK